MKTTLQFILAGLLATVPALAKEVAGIQFEENLSWQQLLAKAKTTNKPIFVDCYATWCGPCKSMDEHVYPDPTVGAYLNEHYISIKVQMDTTKQDNDFVRNWSQDAESLKKQYKINAFPTFLFFSSEGKALHKAVGARTSEDFVTLAEDALDPNKQYYAQLDRYLMAKSYSMMPKLLETIQAVDGDEEAKTFAIDYIDHHLAGLEPQELVTSENLDCLINFRSVAANDPELGPSGRIFRMVYTEAAKPGALSGVKLQSRNFVDEVIIAEEIDAKLYLGKGKDRTVLVEDPDWDGKATVITAKYGAAYAARVLPRTKYSWFRTVKKDYNQAANFWLDWIDQEGVITTSEQERLVVNGWLFGFAFEKCTDPAVLERSIRWAQRVVEHSPSSAALTDTLANLLYKAGRVQEGIALEEKAVAFADAEAAERSARYNRLVAPRKIYRETVERMKKGLPTWGTS